MSDSYVLPTPPRPAVPPFVGGRGQGRAERTATPVPMQRPFSPQSPRAAVAVETPPGLRPAFHHEGTEPVPAPAAPEWNVVVYTPELGREAAPEPADFLAPSAMSFEALPSDDKPEELELPPPSLEYDLTQASLALQEAVDNATRHSDSRAAAEVMDTVARRLRNGEILLASGAPMDDDAAVVAAVLSALLGARR